MVEFLRGENLQWAISILVTSSIAIASLFVPWLLNRRRKTLWYRESSYPLVESYYILERRSIEEPRRKDERIEILFDGVPVPNGYISVIGLWYRGTSAMVEDDYRTPVTVDFGDAQVLDAEIVDLSPEGLPAELSVESPQRVIFSPVAMNDDNAVRARVLLTPGREKPMITGHIVDVKIRDHREYKPFPDIMKSALFAMMGIGAALFVIGIVLEFLFSSDNLVAQSTAFVLFAGLGLLVVGNALLLLTAVLSGRSISRSPI